MISPWISLLYLCLAIIGSIFLARYLSRKSFPKLRNTENSKKAFINYNWNGLIVQFNATHKDLNADRLDRAYKVYHRIMVLAYHRNLLREEGDPHVHRIAPFDKDVDMFWRLHASQPDYDAWCEACFGGQMRPRVETYEEPLWQTLEERQATKLAYKKKYGLLSNTNSDDGFIPPVIVV